MNQVTLTGNLGSDVEMRYTPSGVPVATFPLAVSRSWTDGNGERQQKTTWVRVTCWRKLAELVSEYLAKGSKVLVTGELEQARAYKDKNGEPAASLEVTALTVEFLDTKTKEQGQPTKQTYSREDYHAANPQQAPAVQDEDIPF